VNDVRFLGILWIGLLAMRTENTPVTKRAGSISTMTMYRKWNQN